MLDAARGRDFGRFAAIDSPEAMTPDAADYAWRVGFGSEDPAPSPPRSRLFAPVVRKATPPALPPGAARECGRCDVCGTPVYLRAPPGAVSARVEWWCDHGPGGGA